MRNASLLVGALGLALAPQLAHAGPPVRWSVGVNFGVPYHPRPWYPGYGYYYARPPVVVYQPAPVYVQPAPVVYAAPAVVPLPAAPAPAVAPVAPVAPAAVQAVPTSAVVQANHAGSAARVDSLLQQLTTGPESARRDAAMDLGRMKAQRAVEPLTAMLTGDGSPSAREAAARALGLIGSPRGLNALIHAAQVDADRDVRHSAQFAVEVIRTNLR